MRHRDLNNVHNKVGWVVNCDDHLCFGWSLLRDWAVKISWVGSGAPLPIFSFKPYTLCQVRNNISVNWVNCFESLKDSLGVIISSVLFTCTGDAIVMLDNSHNVEHSLFGLEHCLDLTIGGCLVYGGQSKKFVWTVEGLRRSSHISFIVRSWREVASPVRVFVICVGEQVIVLRWPLNVLGSDRVDIHRGCGID